MTANQFDMGNIYSILEERFNNDLEMENLNERPVSQGVGGVHIPKINVKICNKSGYPLPAYATEESSGFDLVAAIPESITLKPGERKLIPTGIYLELPMLLECQVRPRSGLANKKGITVLNTPGTVDSDYRGQVHANLINLGDEDFVVNPGDRIAQGVLVPVYQANFIEVSSLDELSSTDRGQGGHGHSGI